MPPSAAISPKGSYRVFENYDKLCKLTQETFLDQEVMSKVGQSNRDFKLYECISSESLKIPPELKPVFERAYERHELRYYTSGHTKEPSEHLVQTELERITAAEDTLEAAEARVSTFFSSIDWVGKLTNCFPAPRFG